MDKELKFPEGFYWGGAASAPQTEGAALEDGKKESVWDFWYKTEPERFFDNVGPTIASDFYKQYKDDIKTLKSIGFNSYRTSISWARLIPDGVGEVNKKAVDFYNSVIDEMIANGLEPFMNLYHFDMPMAIMEQGGLESRAFIDGYANYAKTCFELFGDRVKMWFTFNEPIVPVECGYLANYHLPAVVDFKRAVQAAYNTCIANARAVQEFRKANLEEAMIGVILNLSPSYPRSNSKEDLNASHIADLFLNRSFLDPLVHGEFPQDLINIISACDLMPTMVAGDLELLKNYTVDMLGVNYYQPRRVKAKEEAVEYSKLIGKKDLNMEDFFDFYEMPGRKMNPYRGWEIYEEGIYDIMTNIKENYNNLPTYISENGMGVQNEERFLVNGQIQDDYRIEFVGEHLRYLHKAIEEGANCFGYHMWTAIDNWSWLNAYKNRYGFVSIDLATQKRTVKKSGEWFKELATTNTLR